MQALIAFGRGELGLGLGEGIQKLSYLPEARDFIFAVIAEELGSIGAIALIALYLFCLPGVIRCQAQPAGGKFVHRLLLLFRRFYFRVSVSGERRSECGCFANQGSHTAVHQLWRKQPNGFLRAFRIRIAV